MDPRDPRRAGGRYLSGYWRREYTVLDRRDTWFRVRWDDGHETTHCTGWDPRRDRVLFQPD